jgi:ABC-type nitrate/sulfonate/bicarbonate transport system substrate-binding protein
MSATALTLGYLPLVDAAPLLVAQALGFADEEGLDLTLIPAPSWSGLRDMLTSGQVVAAHMLATLPVATAIGLGGAAAPFEVLMVLNLNGNTIGVSRDLAEKMRVGGFGFDFADARAAGLALLAAARGALRIGVPFGFSMHRELIHYWLDGLGQALPPGLEICTVPPPRMAEAMATGEIDAFCVGEPRGSVAVDLGAGTLLLPGTAIWAAAPEKVLATRAGWAEAEPDLAGRLMRSVWRAGRWLGQPQNHSVASDLLATPERLAVASDVIERVLTGRLVISSDGAERQVSGFIEFHAGAANFPWRSQAAWIGARLAKRHGLDPLAAISAARAVFRSDLYRLHLQSTGADLPGASDKLEGSLIVPTAAPSAQGRLILPSDRFFDAQIFDPAQPLR